MKEIKKPFRVIIPHEGDRFGWVMAYRIDNAPGTVRLQKRLMFLVDMHPDAPRRPATGTEDHSRKWINSDDLITDDSVEAGNSWWGG